MVARQQGGNRWRGCGRLQKTGHAVQEANGTQVKPGTWEAGVDMEGAGAHAVGQTLVYGRRVMENEPRSLADL
jgi:hypothetical protein